MLREHKHQEWSHQHAEDSRKTHIDKLFANFDDIKIIDVRKSLEATARKTDELGHKVVVVRMFEPVKHPLRTTINYSKLGRFARNKQEAADLDNELTSHLRRHT